MVFTTFVGIFAATLSVATSALAQANLTQFHSPPTRTSLLELYTSEGCSSCPPAEAWLNELKDSPALWKDFVPVAFHVDYWDSLGWRDRWALPEFSERQRNYAASWQAENIYTPEFVLNGAEWHNWFGWRGAPGSTGDKAGSLEVTSTNQVRWEVTFQPVMNTNENFQIHAAMLAGEVRSDVKAGENKGSTLLHEFTALELVQIGMRTSNGVARGKFILDTSKYRTEKSPAIAVWITLADGMTPIQACGGRLPVAPK